LSGPIPLFDFSIGQELGVHIQILKTVALTNESIRFSSLDSIFRTKQFDKFCFGQATGVSDIFKIRCSILGETMGSSRLIPYVLKLVTFKSSKGLSFYTPQEWKIKYCGKPTTENIDKWVVGYEESCGPSGCNSHLGYDPVLSIEVTDQRKGIVVATWDRKRDRPEEPLFQVL